MREARAQLGRLAWLLPAAALLAAPACATRPIGDAPTTQETAAPDPDLHGPDLFAASQQAVRYMIDHLVETRGLSREQAYVVCSVAVDLKISEIVDAPNWIVSAFLPESIFT